MNKRVFITDLAAYNEGLLSGRWVELPMNNDELQETINEVLKKGWEEAQANDLCCCGEHEEYFITDYEGFDNLFEYENLITLNKFLSACEDVDEDVLDLLMSYFRNDRKDVLKVIEHKSYRVYRDVNSKGDIAYCACCDHGYMEIPDHLITYIDWAAMGCDMFINGNFICDWNVGIAIELY